jgi:hypothetical protein
MDNNLVKPIEEFDLYASTNEAYRKWGFSAVYPAKKDAPQGDKNKSRHQDNREQIIFPSTEEKPQP